MNINNTLEAQLYLERQVDLVAHSFLEGAVKRNNYYNFKCNACGDGKTKTKKRGYILTRDIPWMFYCHNCFRSMTAEKWLKEYYPMQYKDYVKDLLSNRKKDQEIKIVNPTIRTKTKVVKVNKKEYEDTKHFTPVLKGSEKIFNKAIAYCDSRLIPKCVYKDWFVATGGMYNKRLIIPFYDNNKKIYYYQGRALVQNNLKYLSRKDPEGTMCDIYNYYNVDKKEPVIIMEGPIDSLFIQNSVATTGLKVGDKQLDRFKDRYFLLDNDIAGKSKSIQLLTKGESVFMWNEFIKDLNLPKNVKDINDVITHINKKIKFKFKNIGKYFTNSIYDKVKLI